MIVEISRVSQVTLNFILSPLRTLRDRVWELPSEPGGERGCVVEVCQWLVEGGGGHSQDTGVLGVRAFSTAMETTQKLYLITFSSTPV